MRSMEQSNISRPSTADRSTVGQHPTHATDADTNERDPHIRSLTVPDLLSVPLFIAWLRKPFRRMFTRAVR